MSLGNLIVHIGADIKDFVKGMDQAKRSLQRGLGPEAIGLSQNLVTAFVGLGAGILGVGGASIKLAADMEQSRIAFTTMLGSAQAAEAFLQELSDFAASTPFELTGLIESSKKLLAFGFQAQEIKPMLTAIGDAVAGLGGGAAEIDRVTLALGQMQAKGKVSAQEMNQLAELGIPAWKMLADQIGVSIPQAMKMAEKGAISSGVAIPAILEGMTDKFGGMMEKQSKTLLGLFSTAKDNITASLVVIGDSLVDTFDLKTKLAGANKWLGDFSKAIKDGGIRPALEKMIPASLRNTIVIVAGAIAGAMVPALLSMGIAAVTATVPLLPFITAGLAIAALGTQIAKLWESPLARLGTALVVIGALITVFSNARIALALYSAVTKIAAGVQLAFNAVMSANPIGLVIMAIGGLILAGVALYKNWDTVKRVTLQAWGTIKAAVFESIASMIDMYAKFIGVFSKAKAAEAQATADSLRARAASERGYVEDRQELNDQEVRDRQEVERLKALAATQADDAKSEAARKLLEEAGGAAGEEIKIAAEVAETKKDFLDEFAEAFSRSREDLLTEYGRSQDDELTLFQQGQENQLRAKKDALDAQMLDYERFLDDQLQVFENAQEDERIKIEASLDERRETKKNELDRELTDFERAQDNLMIAFERNQEEQLRKFKDDLDEKRQVRKAEHAKELDDLKAAQEQELDAISARYDAEALLRDKDLAAKVNPLKAKIESIRDQEEAEETAKRYAAMVERVKKAEEDLIAARAKGDPKDIAEAQKDLTAILADQQAMITRDARKAEIERLQGEIEAAKKSADEADKARKIALDSEIKAARVQQEIDYKARQEKLSADLEAYEAELDASLTKEQIRLADLKTFKQRELADLLTAEREKLDARMEAFENDLAQEKTNFSRRQEQDLTNKKRELEDLKISKQGQLAEELAQFGRLQELNATQFKRQQEDAVTQYKREFDDLKASFKDKLAEQARFVDDWNTMVGRMKALAPDAVKAPEIVMNPDSGVDTAISPPRPPASSVVAEQTFVERRPATVVEAETTAKAPEIGVVEAQTSPVAPAVIVTEAEERGILSAVNVNAAAGNLVGALQAMSSRLGINMEQAMTKFSAYVGSVATAAMATATAPVGVTAIRGTGGGVEIPIHLEVHGSVGVDDIGDKLVRQIRRELGATI